MIEGVDPFSPSSFLTTTQWFISNGYNIFLGVSMEAEGRPEEGRLRRWFGKLKFWGRGKGIDKGTEKLLRLAYEKVNEHYSTYQLIGGDPGFELKHPTFEDALKDEEVVNLAKKSKFWERAGFGLTAAGGAGMIAGITATSSTSLLSFLALGLTPLGIGLLAGLGAYRLSNKYWKQLKEKMKKKPERKTRIVIDEKVEEYLELAHKKVMEEYAEHKTLAEEKGVPIEFEPRHKSLEDVKRDLTAIELAKKVKKWERGGIASLVTGGVGSIAY